jgi:hypothetical protein
MDGVEYILVSFGAGLGESSSFSSRVESSPSHFVTASSRVESSCLCHLPGLCIFLLRILRIFRQRNCTIKAVIVN